MPDIVGGAGLPFREAIAFFAGKVNIPTQRWTDVWRAGHSHGFMVAGAATDALLDDFRREVARGIAGETSLHEFRRSFRDIVSRHGWEHNGEPGWRARIIFETNIAMAQSAGEYARLTDPDTLAVFPYWQYVHSGSRHPRQQHLAWHGMILRADDPFWKTHFPPNGWNCRCTVRPVSGRDLQRMGRSGPDNAPPIVTRPWTNPSTGDVEHVPVGIDPGFDYNPGEAWLHPQPRLAAQRLWAEAVPAPPPTPPVPPSTPRRSPPAGSDDAGLTTVRIEEPLSPPEPATPRPPPSQADVEAAADELRDFRVLDPGQSRPAPAPRPDASTPPPPPRAEGGRITLPGGPAAPDVPLPPQPLRRDAPTPLVRRPDPPAAFARWRQLVAQQERAPEPFAIGTINKRILRAWATATGEPAPLGRTIIVSADKMKRIVGKDTRIGGALTRALDAQDVAALPRHLARPLAVLRQRDNGNLVFVFRPLSGEAGRVGKVVVAPDRVARLSVSGGERVRFTAPQVISGGLTDPVHLRDAGSYTLLLGKV